VAALHIFFSDIDDAASGYSVLHDSRQQVRLTITGYQLVFRDGSQRLVEAEPHLNVLLIGAASEGAETVELGTERPIS
jgi:hypothetical protein